MTKTVDGMTQTRIDGKFLKQLMAENPKEILITTVYDTWYIYLDLGRRVKLIDEADYKAWQALQESN